MVEPLPTSPVERITARMFSGRGGSLSMAASMKMRCWSSARETFSTRPTVTPRYVTADPLLRPSARSATKRTRIVAGANGETMFPPNWISIHPRISSAPSTTPPTSTFLRYGAIELADCRPARHDCKQVAYDDANPIHHHGAYDVAAGARR